MTWDDYYERFYDVAASTQRTYAYKLTNYGASDEVCEVAVELAFYDKKFAARFLGKALVGGVRFTPEQVMELVYCTDETTAGRIAENVKGSFSKEQVEELHGVLSEASFERVSEGHKINIFDEEDVGTEEATCVIEKPKRRGFFASVLGAIFGAGSAGGSGKKGHGGRCDGDCSNCPAHYGYRYGRWYYGHDHSHGCEFGGNKGSGCMD